jgi:hypothetical protein
LSDAAPEAPSRIFVKFYVDAVRSGLVADMGDRRFRTLMVLASYMDADGACFPLQKTVAEALGVTEETANRRIAELARYEWNGRRIIEVARVRSNGDWPRTKYRILPAAGVGIFRNQGEST